MKTLVLAFLCLLAPAWGGQAPAPMTWKEEMEHWEKHAVSPEHWMFIGPVKGVRPQFRCGNDPLLNRYDAYIEAMLVKDVDLPRRHLNIPPPPSVKFVAVTTPKTFVPETPALLAVAETRPAAPPTPEPRNFPYWIAVTAVLGTVAVVILVPWQRQPRR